MTDDEFITSFENCRLRDKDFHHIDHVRMGFLYISRFPPIEALGRFSDVLQRFAAASGRPNLYHETITWAYFFLIRERMARSFQQSGRRPNWEEFAASNPDLLSWEDHVLKNYYEDGSLASELARTTFLLPNRIRARS